MAKTPYIMKQYVDNNSLNMKRPQSLDEARSTIERVLSKYYNSVRFNEMSFKFNYPGTMVIVLDINTLSSSALCVETTTGEYSVDLQSSNPEGIRFFASEVMNFTNKVTLGPMNIEDAETIHAMFYWINYRLS